MAKIVQLQDGARINLDRIVKYSSTGDVVSFVVDNVLTITYTDANASSANAEFAVTEIDKEANSASNFTVIPYSSYQILSIDPSSFDILTGQLTIRGSGFVAELVGKLYIEDAAGGIDGNGYYMNCTFVDSTTLTAVYGGAGDGNLSPAMKIAYKDSAGLISNVIDASNPSGTTITIP